MPKHRVVPQTSVTLKPLLMLRSPTQKYANFNPKSSRAAAVAYEQSSPWHVAQSATPGGCWHSIKSRLQGRLASFNTYPKGPKSRSNLILFTVLLRIALLCSDAHRLSKSFCYKNEIQKMAASAVRDFRSKSLHFGYISVTRLDQHGQRRGPGPSSSPGVSK